MLILFLRKGRIMYWKRESQMNLLGACFLLQQLEKGKVEIHEQTLKEAQKLVLLAQAEFIAMKEQIKNK